MNNVDLSNILAVEMDKALNSTENKELFSNSSMLEKLAFKKVSEQDQISEVEMELDPSLKKTAGHAECCKCEEEKEAGCDCVCHHKHDKKEATRNPAREAFDALLKVSEDLEAAGFERLAAASIMLADKLIAEAKAKSSKKSEKGSEKSKGSGKKMDMKERMKKMREMQKGKGKKEDKKSSKKSEK